MDKILCSIRDVKANSFGAPVLFMSVPDAVRAFGDLLSDSNTLFGKHPADFQLVHLGEWNDVTGILLPREHVVLCDGANIQS